MSASNQHSNPHVEQLARSLAELHEASEGWPEDNRYVRAAIAGEAALQALEEQLETAQREQALDKAWVTMDHYEDLLAERDGLQEQLETAHKFVRDVLDFTNDPRPATVHDFDAIRAAAMSVLESNPAPERQDA